MNEKGPIDWIASYLWAKNNSAHSPGSVCGDGADVALVVAVADVVHVGHVEFKFPFVIILWFLSLSLTAWAESEDDSRNLL